jgi:hypothetical protein
MTGMSEWAARLDRVNQLSADEVACLEEVWAELGRSYPYAAPPQSDEEEVAVALDAWIAGVVSSKGSFTPAAVGLLMDLAEDSHPGWRVTGLIGRTVALVSPTR